MTDVVQTSNLEAGDLEAHIGRFIGKISNPIVKKKLSESGIYDGVGLQQTLEVLKQLDEIALMDLAKHINDNDMLFSNDMMTGGALDRAIVRQASTLTTDTKMRTARLSPSIKEAPKANSDFRPEALEILEKHKSGLDSDIEELNAKGAQKYISEHVLDISEGESDTGSLNRKNMAEGEHTIITSITVLYNKATTIFNYIDEVRQTLSEGDAQTEAILNESEQAANEFVAALNFNIRSVLERAFNPAEINAILNKVIKDNLAYENLGIPING